MDLPFLLGELNGAKTPLIKWGLESKDVGGRNTTPNYWDPTKDVQQVFLQLSDADIYEAFMFGVHLLGEKSRGEPPAPHIAEPYKSEKS